jgi:hypothetical protein
MFVSYRILSVNVLFGISLGLGCSAPAEDSAELEEELEVGKSADMLPDEQQLLVEPAEQPAPAGAGYCIAYQHTDRLGLQFAFKYPKDYNDLHRKPAFGDEISSIECVGMSLIIWEHVQWAGNALVIDAGKYISNLHQYGMGDKISSVRWVGEDTHAGSCTAYQHKNYQGAHITFANRQDFNDLHRMNWGDVISSYQCTPGVVVYFCKHDQWSFCQPFKGSDADIHGDGFGDNISSVTW